MDVVAAAFTGEEDRANGGRRGIEVGRVEDIDERTESWRRFGSLIIMAVLPLTLTLDVDESGVPLAIRSEIGR